MDSDKDNSNILYAILSAITFVILIILLTLICIYENKGLQKFFFIILCISEIFNCIPKFLQIIRNNKNILCYLQVSFSLISDIGTLTTTTLMSIKTYDYFKNKNYWLKKKKNQNIIKLFNIIFPMIFLFFLFFTEEKDEQCWLNKISNIIIYCIFVILIIINFVIIFAVYRHLIGLKKKYEEFEKDLLEEDDLSAENKNLQSNKIKGIICEYYIYSIIIPIVWIYFTISRIFLSEYGILMKIHMIISSIRGLIYTIIYIFNFKFTKKKKITKNNNNLNSSNESIKN